MNKPLIPPDDPRAQAMLRQMMGSQPVDVTIVPRIEVRQLLAQAIAQLNVVRGQIINTAAQLEKTRGQIAIAAGQIRAQSLGKLPAHLGIADGEIPTERDIADLQSVFEMFRHIVDVLGEGARATPFEDPAPATP